MCQVNEGDLRASLTLVKSFAKNCIEKGDKVFLMLVFLYRWSWLLPLWWWSLSQSWAIGKEQQRRLLQGGETGEAGFHKKIFRTRRAYKRIGFQTIEQKKYKWQGASEYRKVHSQSIVITWLRETDQVLVQYKLFGRWPSRSAKSTRKRTIILICFGLYTISIHTEAINCKCWSNIRKQEL